MVRALTSVTIAAAALLAIAVMPAVAQNKCDASKLKATGSKCDGKSKCIAKGASKGIAVDGACMTKAETKFSTAFGKAEAKGGCSTTGDAAAIEAMVDAHVLDTRSELWNDEPAENDCASSKLKAAGKKCSCKLKCHSKAATKGTAVDPACLTKCETKFSSSFTKAENKGGCTTTGDAAAIEAKVDAFVIDAAASIQNLATTTTTSTTTTTIPTMCGNGVIEGNEECDDSNTNPGDGCDGACQLESTNPALCAGVPTVMGTSITSVRVASGLTDPVHVSAPRLDTHRVFVVEKPGRIRIIENGTLLPTPFLAIEGIVNDGFNEQGLLSVAFHPDYESNGFFYVYYTNNSSNLVIARYSVSGNPNLADAGSAHTVVTIPHPGNLNHNGGNLNFNPIDGMLYAAIGDGGSGGDPPDNAQNDLVMLGKLLRIDPLTDAITIWAKGLRNPWRFSFDRANGDLYIGDVGQGSWEEIDYQPAPVTSGTNWGWDVYEGRHCFEPTPLFPDCASIPPSFGTMPVLEYCNGAHSEPACSTFQTEKGFDVAGGFVYRGCTMPDVQGEYFYTDTAAGWIRSFRGVSGGNAQNLLNRTAALDPPGSQMINSPSSFGEDARGELYITDLGDGEVYKIIPGP